MGALLWWEGRSSPRRSEPEPGGGCGSRCAVEGWARSGATTRSSGIDEVSEDGVDVGGTEASLSAREPEVGQQSRICPAADRGSGHAEALRCGARPERFVWGGGHRSHCCICTPTVSTGVCVLHAGSQVKACHHAYGGTLVTYRGVDKCTEIRHCDY